MLKATTRGEFDVGGGTVEILDGSNPQTGERVTVAGWVGPWHAAYGFFYEKKQRTDAVLSYFSDFQFTDTTEGVTVDLRTHLLARERVVLHIGGDTMMVEDVATSRVLPQGRGTGVEVGRAWHDRGEMPEGPTVPLVYVEAETAAATIFVRDGKFASTERMATELTELKIA